MTTLRLEATPGVAGWGIALHGGRIAFRQTLPLRVELDGQPPRILEAAYDRVERTADDDLRCFGSVQLDSGCTLHVDDEWRLRDGDVEASRVARVSGTAGGAFLTSLMLQSDREEGWVGVEPFVPGVAYGNAPRVAPLSLAGLPARQAGVETILIREDRMAAPLFAVRYPDGSWFGVLHLDPDGGTIAADGLEEDGGETLVDHRFQFASLGGDVVDGELRLGVTYPGTEGEVTYSTGGLPLRQLRAWRRRFHPAEDGMEQRYRVVFRLGQADDVSEFYRAAWEWAFTRMHPHVEPAPIDKVVRSCAAVLAGQVVTVSGRTGVPLEADAVEPRHTDEDTAALMGFVGANTDAGCLLLRVGDSVGGLEGARYRRLGEQVLDTFARIPLQPPAGEGFSTEDGRTTTYRRFRDRPAVYARSVADGALAMLEAWRWDEQREVEHDQWLAWAVSGGDWLLSQQAADGSLPRAWVAGQGDILDHSLSASFVVVPFLTALSTVTGEAKYLNSAVRAAEFGWEDSGHAGAYAGATLDNPDVVDKEAAILSAEGFLDLFDATADPRWLTRAQSAATVAASWIYLWDVPMPVDADPAALHWKPGVPTIGHQLITTGCSMADGFLAVNASAFARLFAATGEQRWLDIARLVVHGSTSMLALEDRPFDLRGPGWQQEHWSFAPLRGFGLNRRWLPWVAVAHIRGIHRVEDLGPAIADLVLKP